MKAIILAADNNEFYMDGKNVPKCFLPLNKNITIIERQIRILNLLGFSKDDILLVVGSLGPWKNDKVKNKLSEIDATIIINKETKNLGNFFSLILAFNKINKDDIIIMDGDLVFEKKIIDKNGN